MSAIHFRWFGRRGLRAAVLLLAGLAIMAGLLLVVPAGAAGDPATLTIVKETDPDGGMGFPFTLASDGVTLVWGTQGTSPGQFRYPRGLTVDARGDTYVADAVNHRVQKFDSLGNFLLQFGSLGTAAGLFNQPSGVAVDASGNIYVADSYNNRIQKFDSGGNYLLSWGTAGGNQSQFSSPYGLAVDGSGNVFVADWGNQRVQKFDSQGTFLLTWGWDVVNGGGTAFEVCRPSDICKSGRSGSGDGQFFSPLGIAVDGTGNVYVPDNGNHRVQKFSGNGDFLLKFGSLGTTDGKLQNPSGISVNAQGEILVADRLNSRLQKFGASGNFLRKWGSNGTAPGQFKLPHGVAVDAAGRIYVSDTDNHRIQKFVDAAFDLDDDEPTSFTLDPATYTVSEWMPEGWNLADVACSGGTPQVDINKVALTLLPGDDITCTFTNAQESSITIIKEVVGQVPTADWQFSGDLGDFSFPPEGFQTDFYPLTPGSYTVTEAAVPGYSQSVSCDTGETGAGSVTIDLQAGEDVTCTFVNTYELTTLTLVKETDPDEGTVFPFTVVGTLNIWGGFENPRGVAVDSSGNVYVSDYQSWVRKYDSTGTNLLAQWGGYGVGNGQLRHPTGLTLDDDDFVYVADSANQRVVKFTADGTYVTHWGSLGSGDGQFLHVRDIAVSGSGNVYVIDRDRHDIQVFDTNGVFQGRWGMRGNGDGQFESPESIAIDSNGRVYVADTGNSRIQVFDAGGVYQSQWGHATGLNHPSALEIDRRGNVYVADTWNDLVQKFDSSGIYLAAWTVARAIYNPAPQAIAVNDRNQVYVGDTANSRIQMFFDAQPTLGDGESVTHAVSPGSYEVRELLPNGWAASNITCQGGNPQVVGSRVQLALARGDAVVCTYTDTTLPEVTAGLTVAKQADLAGGQDFRFDVLSSLNRWGNFENPRGVAVDSFGNVYLTDYAGTVYKYDRTGTHLLLYFGGYGNAAGKFSHARGLDVDDDDLVYVTDFHNHRVQKLDSQGNYLDQWGSQGPGAGEFLHPRDVAVASDGRVYVVEFGNHRVQVFDTNGVYLYQWGARGSGDGQFESPEGIAVASDGHVYVADTGNNRVQKFAADGTFVTQWGSLTGIGLPNGIDVDRNGNVYVTDTANDRIQVFKSNGDFLTAWIVPRSTYSSSPSAVAVSENGDVYVADMPNNRIHRFYNGQLTLHDGDSVRLAVPPGTYDIRETLVGDWELTGIACNSGTPQPLDAGIRLMLSPDDDISCTFTNYSPNQPPVAGEDTYVTDEDLALVVNAPGVLGNDSDPNTDPLTAALVDNVTHGTLAFNADGSFTYTPAADYHGPDSFTYKANDGAEDSNVVTVSITINPVNDPPVAADLSVATDEDTPVALSLSASDIEGDNLTYTVVSGPAHGELSGTPPEVTYTPAADYHGPDSFTYQADDAAEDSNIATVSITVNPVNDPPVVAWSPAPASPATLGVTTTAAVTFSDVDSGDSHSCVWNWGDGTSDGPAPCAPGTVAGSHLYAAIGSYSVSMTVTDNAEEGSVTANVAVTWPFAGFFPPVNNPPVVNTVKAGSGVPVKFSLGGDYGLGIIAEGYPKSVRVMCDTGDPTDEIEETVTAGSSSLQYNALTGQYTYVWKTVKLWTGTCRQFRLMLTDGTTHVADFKFK